MTSQLGENCDRGQVFCEKPLIKVQDHVKPIPKFLSGKCRYLLSTSKCQCANKQSKSRCKFI